MASIVGQHPALGNGELGDAREWPFAAESNG